MRCPQCNKFIFFFEVRKDMRCRHCKASLTFPEVSFYLVYMAIGALMFFAIYAASGFAGSAIVWIAGIACYVVAGFITGALFAPKLKLKNAAEVHQRG